MDENAMVIKPVERLSRLVSKIEKVCKSRKLKVNSLGVRMIKKSWRK